MSGTPSSPGSNEPMGGAGDPQQTPKEVQNATNLWFLAIGISVIFVIPVFVVIAVITGYVLYGFGATDGAMLLMSLVVTLLVYALEFVLVVRMRAGANWARIVLTVLGAIGILSAVTALSGGVDLGGFLGLVSLMAIASAMYFMYRPASNAYFSAYQV